MFRSLHVSFTADEELAVCLFVPLAGSFSLTSLTSNKEGSQQHLQSKDSALRAGIVTSHRRVL